MMTRNIGVIAGAVLAIGVLVAPASAAIGLNYQGSFGTGLSGVYDGDLSYDPSRNSGAGSLVLSGGHGNKLYEMAIPALVTPTNFNCAGTGNGLGQLNIATKTTSTASLSAWGLTYAADGSVYWMTNDGYQGCVMGTINNDGTNSTTLKTLGYKSMSNPAALVSTSFFSGYDKLVVSGVAGVTGGADLRITALNTATWATTPLMQYTTANNRTGVLAGDTPQAAVVMQDGADQVLAILVKSGGTATPANDNRLLFYRLSDIANNILAGHNLYDAQPYQTIDLQSKVFTPASASYAHLVYGLTFDSVHKVLYTAESNYSEAVIVSAWAVTPEPATLLLLACASLAALRRRQ